MKFSTRVFPSAFLIIFLMLASIEVSAQSNWEAGIRFGDNWSAEATIPIGATPRLHARLFTSIALELPLTLIGCLLYLTGQQG